MTRIYVQLALLADCLVLDGANKRPVLEHKILHVLILAHTAIYPYLSRCRRACVRVQPGPAHTPFSDSFHGCSLNYIYAFTTHTFIFPPFVCSYYY